MKNWMVSLIAVIGSGISIYNSQIQAWLVTHPQAGVLIAGLYAILAHLMPSPVSSAKNESESGAGTAAVIVAALLLSSAPARAQQPVPNTYVSTGIVTNYQVPYHPAPYASYGTLLNSASSTLPTFAGFRYELYMDATGKPAYAGLATLKVIVYHKNRWFCFADAGIGGAGSVSSISTALQAGGGCGAQIGKYSASNTPHWEVFVEPEAQRVPALANGTNPAFLAGVSYSFNRPQ